MTERIEPSKEAVDWSKVPEGPYFVTFDDAEDTIDHKHSGLAMVDTGRSGDWPIARLCEWPTARAIASLPDLIAERDQLRLALQESQQKVKELEQIAREKNALMNKLSDLYREEREQQQAALQELAEALRVMKKRFRDQAHNNQGLFSQVDSALAKATPWLRKEGDVK